MALDRELLTRALATNLKGKSSTDIVQLFYSEYDAIIDFARLCEGKRACQKLSLLFNPHRLDTPTIKSKSLTDALKTDGFCSGLARASAWKDEKLQDRNLLYQVLQLGVNGIQYVNEFPPHTARQIYQQFNAKRILDPCAGWGGRMIGAASIGAFYHGFEPSTRSYTGLLRLGEFLKSFRTGFDFRIENLPFEDCNLTDTYDISLTSPPYYDTEHYAEEATQARLRYQSFNDFVNGFYVPMVIIAASACTHGLVLNIGDRKYPLTQTIITELADTFTIEDFDGVSLSGAGGLGKENKKGESFIRIYT